MDEWESLSRDNMYQNESDDIHSGWNDKWLYTTFCSEIPKSNELVFSYRNMYAEIHSFSFD